MKNLILYIFLLSIFFNSCKKDNSSAPATSINMGAGNTNDVFYSLANGVVASIPGTNWDIAFNTNVFSPTIITNGGAGIKLYTYPGGDTSVWNTTLSITSIGNWPAMYNADTSWTWGAFQRNTTSSPFDYGWGVYDLSTNEVIGDSLFIIQLQDQTYRKLWMKKKAANNTYIFEYANLDGSDSKIDSVNSASYSTKNFIYYSIAQEKIVDREPAVNTWDFVATRYIASTGVAQPTLVTGFLTNFVINVNPTTNPFTLTPTGTMAAEVTNVNVSSTAYSSANFSTHICTIGWDWASYNQNSKTYSILPQQIYFLKTPTANIYKIVFAGDAGSGTGIIQFDQTKIK